MRYMCTVWLTISIYASLLKNKTKECQIIFFIARHAHKWCYYSDVIPSFDWKSVVKHDGGV